MSLVLVNTLESSVVHDSFVDGEGVRLTLFLAGCHHFCKGCHNPSTWNIEHGVKTPIEDIVAYLIPYLSQADVDGLTLSGGDPVLQTEGVKVLLQQLRNALPMLNVWLYTGDLIEDLQPELLKLVDVVVDGPYEQTLRYPAKPFRGSNNQRLIHLLNGEIQRID